MKPLRIAIDGRMYQQSGIGRYIRNLISNLQVLDKKNEYIILLGKEDYVSLVLQENFQKVLADFSWYGIKEQVKLPKIIQSLNVDLMHFPHFNVPFFNKGKYVVTIHDLIHQHFSMKRSTTHGPVIYKIKQQGYNIIFKNALSKSLKILTPSLFVKDQLVQDWNQDSEKIVVTPEAVDAGILKIANENTKEIGNKVLKNLGISKPYIFYIGNAHPHKNVEGLIKSFEYLKKKNLDLKLVLAGNDHYFWQRIKQEFRNEAIIFAGQVKDSELVAIYKNAELFVMPSFEEGFGIPVLEAFACGCPVVCSNLGSLPEIGKNAVVYFNPYDISDMTDKISKVLNNKEIKNTLIKKGKQRAMEFSWKKLAEQTLEVYRKCV